jgi:nucleotide-binding universal stress UspA family protein
VVSQDFFCRLRAATLVRYARRVSIAQSILVTTDFSQASELALEAAPVLARQNDARVTLVHVAPTMSLAPGELEQSTSYQRELEDAIHQHLDRLCETYLAGLPDVKTALLRGRNSADAICEFAAENDVDLILLATHGRSGIQRFLLGSVAEQVVRHAPCPVLVMRSKARD